MTLTQSKHTLNTEHYKLKKSYIPADFESELRVSVGPEVHLRSTSGVSGFIHFWVSFDKLRYILPVHINMLHIFVVQPDVDPTMERF